MSTLSRYAKYSLQTRALSALFPIRPYSTVVSARVESVTVKCRSNGQITLNIYHPFVGGQGAPILLYLPRGPLLPHARAEESIIKLLSATSKSTIVRINYRLDEAHPYPTPVHDVLAGYDWVRRNLTPWIVRDGREISGQARLGVCGELVGGGLASMLALTECRMGQTRIAAAAVGNPLIDWISPLNQPEHSSEENHYQKVRSRAAESNEIQVKYLKDLRDTCFKRATADLDPFASPVLFFRTAGADSSTVNASHDFGDSPADSEMLIDTGRRRKAHRVFPPLGSGLQIPAMRISVGSNNVFRSQGEELANLMRKSFVRQHVRNSGVVEDDEETPLFQNADAQGELTNISRKAEEKVSIALNPGEGLWSSLNSTAWHADIALVGQWFRNVLG